MPGAATRACGRGDPQRFELRVADGCLAEQHRLRQRQLSNVVQECGPANHSCVGLWQIERLRQHGRGLRDATSVGENCGRLAGNVRAKRLVRRVGCRRVGHEVAEQLLSLRDDGVEVAAMLAADASAACFIDAACLTAARSSAGCDGLRKWQHTPAGSGCRRGRARWTSR